jgi:AcrR family transcriptional regulator
MGDGSKGIPAASAASDATLSKTHDRVGRSAKRDEARRKVEAVALTLFSHRGFDEVRVEQICAEAGIAPATFYRYFGSKEGVVFDYEESFLAAAADLGASIDPAQPIPDQLRDLAGLCALFLQEQSEMLAMRDAIVRVHPELLQRTFAVQRAFEDRVASGLASRRHETAPSPATLLDAAVCLVVVRLGVRAWRSQEGSSLPDLIEETYASLRARLG